MAWATFSRRRELNGAQDSEGITPDAGLSALLAGNRAWADEMDEREPGFFQRLAALQTPDFLWIGCSDSRVPANQIVDRLPGELFVHRNVANLVVHSDLNGLSVLQFAVDVLRVSHVVVCGHYGCGGVLAALSGARVGLVDNWLGHVQDVAERHAALLDATHSEEDRARRLVELNVVEQVRHVARTTIVRDAWARSQQLAVHGLVYAIEDGRLRDLGLTLRREAELETVTAAAVARIGSV
jgi:carbonic anhydrase